MLQRHIPARRKSCRPFVCTTLASAGHPNPSYSPANLLKVLREGPRGGPGQASTHAPFLCWVFLLDVRDCHSFMCCVSIVQVLLRIRCNGSCEQLQHIVSHCNTMHHTATHCITLQHIASHCNTLYHTSTHCITLQHIVSHCNTLYHTATHCITLQHIVSHCNTL